MVDARRILDALIGSRPQGPGAPGTGAPQGRGGGGLLDEVLGALTGGQGTPSAGQVLGQATGGLQDAAQRLNQATGVGAKVDQAASQVTGVSSTGDLVDKAKGFFERNPGMAQAAVGLAGLVLTSRQGRGLTRNVAGLGGLALIGGLAYKAFQNLQAGQPLVGDASTGTSPPQRMPGAATIEGQPGPDPTVAPRTAGAAGDNPLRRPSPTADRSLFDPASATEDDALLYVRAMVAAAAADGHIDETERQRLTSGLAEAGIDPDATRWLERELADPASVDELAAGVRTPEKAAQIYSAARIAIDADTLQEREFLRQLAQALDLEPGIVADIDATASTLKTG